MKRRILAGFLSLCMMISFMPTHAFATELPVVEEVVEEVVGEVSEEVVEEAVVEETVAEEAVVEETVVEEETAEETATEEITVKLTSEENSEAIISDETPVAKIGETPFSKIEDALTAAKAGDTITLFADVEMSAILVIDKAITLDGNNHKLTSTADRAINVKGADGVTIKNLTIDVSGERAINVIQNATNVTIEKVTAKAANYALNVASSAPAAVVKVEESDLTGLNTVNIASAGSNITLEDTTITCNDQNVNEAYAAISLNKDGEGATIATTGCTFVINGDSIKAANSTLNGVITIDGSEDEVLNVVAIIEYETNYYSFYTLATALKSAANGETVKIIRDFTAEESATVPEGKTVILDLNGKTISGKDEATKSYGLININPGANLTINDTVGTGKITLVSTNNRGWNAYSSVISNQRGKLTVNGGTIEHLGGTDMAYGIDNLTNGKGTYAETVIAGGTVKSPYRAIRQFLNGVESQNILTISGGTVEGSNKSVWMQDANKYANNGSVTISENANIKGDVYLTATAGSETWPIEVSIAKAALKDGSEVLTSNVPAGYVVEEVNGVYGVDYFVAVIGDERFETLQAAVDAAENGEEIVVVSDIRLSDTVTVNGNVVIDLNGYTISQEKACTESYSMIKNNGTLTIKDSSAAADGKISFKDTGAGDPSFGWGSYTITNNGTLVVENGTIEHLGEQNPGGGQPNVHMYCAIFQYSGSTTINGGTISTPTYRSARLWKGEMTINGGEFVGQLWVQAVDNTSKLTINGGSFAPTGNDGSSVFVENKTYPVAFAVTGGEFATKIGCSKADDLKGVITGGKFTESAKKNTSAVLVHEDYAFTADSEGNYLVLPKESRTLLEGAGTEASPYLIKNIDDLKLFRNSVNAGETTYNAPGVYVALDSDIDMAGIDWSVNIGDDCSVTFDGIFDGKGHTIKNFSSTETAAKADGYICTGLFGAIYGDAVVKNFTMENVSIDTGDFVGNNVAAVVGFAYSGKGSVENVNVIGNISINAKDVTGVGAIVGYDYYGDLTVKNCKVAGNDGSVITGAAYVGGVIGYASTDMTAEGNTVQNMAINATSCAVGGVAGIALEGAKFVDNTVEDTALTVSHENWQNSAAVTVGTITKTVTISNTAFSNVTVNGQATETMAGSVHAERPTTPVAAVAARVGDVYYTTLEAAVAAADNTTVTVEGNIALGAKITIPAEKTVTLDLNGKVVSMEDFVAGTSCMIENRGNLTIKDSAGKGKLTIKSTNVDTGEVPSYANNTISNYGTITVESGTIENTSAGSACYAIDNYAGSKATINGGKLAAYKTTLRVFNWTNGEAAKTVLNINGGEIVTEDGYALNFNMGNAPYVELNITGGTFTTNDTDYNLAAYIVSKGSAENVVINVENGVFNGNFALNGITCTTMAEGNVSISGGTFEGVICYNTPAYRFITGGKYAVSPEDYLADGFVAVEEGELYAVKSVNEIKREAPEVSVYNEEETGKPVVTWDEVDFADEYEVYRATSKSGKYSKVETTEETSFEDAKAKAGTKYYYKVKAICKANSNNSSEFSNIVECTCDLAITTVTATSVEETGKIKVTWKAVSGAEKYEVYRATSEDGEYTKVTSTTKTSYTNSGLQAGTVYFYKVKAVHEKSAANSALSDAAECVCVLGQTTVTATNVAATGKIELTWKAVDGAEAYEVWRSVNEYGVYRKITAVSEVSFEDATATAGSAYYYKVRAINGIEAATGAYSAVVSRTCDLAMPVVTTSNVEETGKVKLSWNTVDGAEKYEVYRATSKSGKYSKVATTTEAGYTDAKAKAGSTYYYKVKAVHENAVANSAYSAVVSRACDIAQPVVTITNVEETGKIKITWGKISGAEKYEVWRSTSKYGDYSKAITTTRTSYTNSTAEAGVTYYYKVKAVHEKSSANSAFSNAAAGMAVIARPEVTAANIAETGKIQLTWKAVEGAAEYTVWRADSKDGEYSQISAGTSTVFTDTSAVAGNAYYYKVRAIHETAAVSGAYSEAVSRTCDLARPEVSISAGSKGKPELTWDEVDGAVKYEVYRATSKSGKYSKVFTTTNTSYTNTGAKKGTTYYYKVKAVHTNTAANSAYSLVDSIKSK